MGYKERESCVLLSVVSSAFVLLFSFEGVNHGEGSSGQWGDKAKRFFFSYFVSSLFCVIFLRNERRRMDGMGWDDYRISRAAQTRSFLCLVIM